MQRPQFESKVFDAAVAAGSAPTATELVEALDSAFASVGFAYFRVVEAVSDGDARVLRYVMGKVNPEWEATYGEDRLAQQDPRLRRALTSSEPFFLSEVLAAPDVRDAERLMIIQAEQFGLRESYVLSHRTADNRQFAAVLIGSGRPIDGIYRVAVHTLASAFLLAALRLGRQTTAAANKSNHSTLTIRQLQCLEWSRRGKSSGDIGRILNLSPRTIDEHLATACKTLGVRTRVQAVSFGLSAGLLPYRAADVSGLGRNP